jgi:DNA sulfur modification protein DndD
MILRSITLENFGLYAGTTKIDLAPRRRRGRESPIVLVGGKNGAGKTTLLEAVRLSLYGRRALGSRVAQSEYEQYLREAVHRSGKDRSAAVGIEFDYAEDGAVHRYEVQREWTLRDKKVVENLTVRKDGSAISSVPRDEWHQFLQELIPPGVSQLFFFDGEKIQEIADGDQDNEQLAEAIRGLLGIELVVRLRTDIGLFLARHQGGADAAATGRLESLLRETATMQRSCSDLSEKIAELVSTRDSQARAAEQIRRRFVAEGGDAALKRARVEAEQHEVQKKCAAIEHELRDLANGLLPFAVAPKVVKSFQKALSRKSGGKGRKETAKQLEDAFGAWRRSRSGDRKADWNAKHWSDLARFIGFWAQVDDREQGTTPAFKEVGDGTAALARLAEIEAAVRPRAVQLAAELEKATNRLSKLETSLIRADSAAAGVMLDELRLSEQRVGATEATLHAQQEELRLLRGQLVTLDRERRKLLEEQARSSAASGRMALAGQTANALAAYERRLLEHKIGQLRSEFVRRFNQLARKAEFVSDVRIDPETFAVTLIDRDGNDVQKSSLSAGEKQIYAIAMLWALARTSGRPLPMIIDTPLARLDSEHRSNLIERYFPAASHQVVLLSTDTEVDVRLLQALGPNVSHTYRLDYDPESQSTTAALGYFGEARDEEGRRALQQA